MPAIDDDLVVLVVRGADAARAGVSDVPQPAAISPNTETIAATVPARERNRSVGLPTAVAMKIPQCWRERASDFWSDNGEAY